MPRTDMYGKQLPVYETCRMCATTQTLTRARRKTPQMYRAGDGSVQCSDPIECLARRHDLIEKMQAALDMVWKFVDEHSPRSDCGDVRGVAPPRAISSGLSAALASCSERWSNHLPQGFSSNVDKSWRFAQWAG